jgi:drug/metabolite transporter (DMT)-like permease
MNRPLLLLFGTGTALGLNFPLGKLAMSNAVNPALWAAVISLGAGLALFLITQATEREASTGASTAKFAIISAFISYVVPNFLTFLVIPKIGSGLAAIMFALSPVVTALLSLMFRVHPPNLLGLSGIAVGLIGALIIIFSKGVNARGLQDLWIFVALLIPVFLGLGNIYRTMAWPQGASPRSLAAKTNLAAVPFLLAATLAQTRTIDVAPLATVPTLVAAQLAVSTIMFLMFFKLQLEGGPTYLSQIGYVAAAVGVVIGVVYFGETYPMAVWIGAGVVAAGIALSTWGQVWQSKV